MGYGEVGGGGSVLWHVVHGGDPGVAAGRDPRPAQPRTADSRCGSTDS
jgi:hypothetical protein